MEEDIPELTYPTWVGSPDAPGADPRAGVTIAWEDERHGAMGFYADRDAYMAAVERGEVAFSPKEVSRLADAEAAGVLGHEEAAMIAAVKKRFPASRLLGVSGARAPASLPARHGPPDPAPSADGAVAAFAEIHRRLRDLGVDWARCSALVARDAPKLRKGADAAVAEADEAASAWIAAGADPDDEARAAFRAALGNYESSQRAMADIGSDPCRRLRATPCLDCGSSDYRVAITSVDGGRICAACQAPQPA